MARDSREPQDLGSRSRSPGPKAAENAENAVPPSQGAPASEEDKARRYNWNKINAIGVCYLSAMSEGLVGGEFGHVGTAVKSSFQLSDIHLQIWLAVSILGSMVGGALAGSLVYNNGCLPMLRYSLLVMMLADLVRAQAPNFTVFVFGAFFGYLAVAINMVALTQYLSEVTSKASRGRACALVDFVVGGGSILKAWLCFLLVDSGPDFWRLALKMCIFPAAAALLLTCQRLPESPRYLQRTATMEEAAKTLADLLGTTVRDAEVQEALAKWREEAAQQTKGKSVDRLGQYRQVVFTDSGQASLLPCLAQGLCGMNVLAGFVGLILEGAGMPRKQSQGLIVVGSLAQLVASCATSMFLVDRFGRRMLLLVSAAGISATFAALLVLPPSAPATLAVVMMVGRVLFSVGFGPVPYVYAPEILPNHLRSAGLSLGKVAQQCGVVVSVNGGLALLGYSHAGTFVFFIWVNAGLLAGIWLRCPETLGQPLEQEWTPGKLSQKTGPMISTTFGSVSSATLGDSERK